MSEPEPRVPVLVVGGGIAGLTTAMLLRWRGIPVMLVERHVETAKRRRAPGVHRRSMELLRVTGLEQEFFEDDSFERGFTEACHP